MFTNNVSEERSLQLHMASWSGALWLSQRSFRQPRAPRRLSEGRSRAHVSAKVLFPAPVLGTSSISLSKSTVGESKQKPPHPRPAARRHLAAAPEAALGTGSAQSLRPKGCL